MNITSGKILSAQKVVLYGPEGIGKSTFASALPDPLFIDTEGSTKHMDVRRFDAPTSWTMLLSEVTWVRDHPSECKTLVIDTADWAEQLCINSVLATYQKKGIEDFGYGKGYVYVAEEFGRLLNLLDEVIGKGIHICITAHAKMRKFEQPDEMGAYDRWEMKLSKQVAPMLKEWADMVLFATYKTIVVKDGKGENAKSKASGGKRIMYTSHHPCWDAKNRHGLPDELPFEFGQIAHCLPSGNAVAEAPAANPTVPAAAAAPAPTSSTVKPTPVSASGTVSSNAATTVSTGTPDAVAAVKAANVPVTTVSGVNPVTGELPNIPPDLPAPLRQLMAQYAIDEAEIRKVVSKKGYYPEATPISNYDPNFINGALVAGWEMMLPMIIENRDLF